MRRERGISSGKTALIWICGVLILILADQAAKYQAVRTLKGSKGISLITGVLELQYVENRGMAFGMLEGKRILLVGICMIFFAALTWIFVKIPKTGYYMPLIITGGVLAAGAAGNFIDRMWNGYVIDFIYVALIDFPVFNLADIYVVCSAIVLVILVLFHYGDDDFEFISKKRCKG